MGHVTMPEPIAKAQRNGLHWLAQNDHVILLEVVSEYWRWFQSPEGIDCQWKSAGCFQNLGKDLRLEKNNTTVSCWVFVNISEFLGGFIK